MKLSPRNTIVLAAFAAAGITGLVNWVTEPQRQRAELIASVEAIENYAGPIAKPALPDRVIACNWTVIPNEKGLPVPNLSCHQVVNPTDT